MSGKSSVLVTGCSSGFGNLIARTLAEAGHEVYATMRAVEDRITRPAIIAAVVQLGRFHFRGFLGWLIWLTIHLMRLVGFRNRLMVLIDWAWDYFFYDRAVRVIMPEGRCPWTKGNEQDSGTPESDAYCRGR